MRLVHSTRCGVCRCQADLQLECKLVPCTATDRSGLMRALFAGARSPKRDACALHARSYLTFVQGRAPFLEMRRSDFLVISVWYVSRSNTLKSWVSEIVNDWFLSTDTKRTYLAGVKIA